MSTGAVVFRFGTLLLLWPTQNVAGFDNATRRSSWSSEIEHKIEHKEEQLSHKEEQLEHNAHKEEQLAKNSINHYWEPLAEHDAHMADQGATHLAQEADQERAHLVKEADQEKAHLVHQLFPLSAATAVAEEQAGVVMEEAPTEASDDKPNVLIVFLQGIHFDLISNMMYLLMFAGGYVYRMHTKPHRPELDPIAFILDINGTGHIDKGMVDEAIVMLIKGFEKDVLKLEWKEKMLKLKFKLWMVLAILCFAGEIVWVLALHLGWLKSFDTEKSETLNACCIIGLVPVLYCFEHLYLVHKRCAHIESVKMHFQVAEKKAEEELAEEGKGLRQPLLA